MNLLSKNILYEHEKPNIFVKVLNHLNNFKKATNP